MNRSGNWQLVKVVLYTALELGASERRAFLENRAGRWRAAPRELSV